MDYNTTRSPLVFREYGRNVQRLIKYIADIKDKDERTKKSKALVETLAQMNPQQSDNEEYRHKLWDHMFIMSDFKLDVDAPFPKPKSGPVTISKPKKRLPYPQQRIRYRHYGQNVELLIKKIKEMKDKEKREAAIKLLASYMKMAHKNWSRENVSDDIVLADLNTLAGGDLNVDEDQRIPMLRKNRKRKNNPKRKRRNRNRKNRSKRKR